MECREFLRNPGSMGTAARVNDPRRMLRCAIARIGITGIGMHESLLRRHKRQMSRFVVKDAFKFSEPLHIGNIATIKSSMPQANMFSRMRSSLEFAILGLSPFLI